MTVCKDSNSAEGDNLLAFIIMPALPLITFKLVISHWTNEMSLSTHSRILFSSEYFHYKIFVHEKCLENQNDNFEENFSRPGIIDARARRLTNTAVG
jgi:hypothetical protein